MLTIYKKIGETPLEALIRLRKRNNKYKKKKLSYIGRLDPMAEGKMIVLVGERENGEREKYLHFDKEYKSIFLLGIQTDSCDILGLVERFSGDSNSDKNKIGRAILSLEKIKKQKYPWFSGRTIKGKKMFDIYKEGEIKGIKRPIQKVKIKILSKPQFVWIKKGSLKKDVFSRIKKVRGDFRQGEIKKGWQKFFAKDVRKKFLLVSFSLNVSSGTFVRALSEEISKNIEVPSLLYKLKRTKICI